MKEIFISYSSKDTVQTEVICRYLESHGFDCWVSYRDIRTGADYPETITKAIRESKIFLVIISRNSLASEQVKKELTIANNMIKSGMKLFMIMLDDTLNPERLNDSFDYILAGIQACWWSQSASRIDLIQQFSLLLKSDSTDSEPDLKSKESGTRKIKSAETNDASARKYRSTQRKKKKTHSSPKIPDKTFPFTRDILVKKPYIICLVLLILTMFGTLMIQSASADYCEEIYSNSFHFTSRHILFTVLGMMFAIWLSKISTSHFKNIIPYISIITLILLFLLWTDLVYEETYPYSQWLQIGPFLINPALPALLGYILYIAYFTEKYGMKMSKYRYLEFIWGISGIFSALLLTAANNLALSMLVLAIGFGTTLVFSDTKLFHLGTLITFIATIIFSIISLNSYTDSESYRNIRLQAWLHPEEYADSYAYLPTQLKKAITTCGFWGKGLSNGSLLDDIPTGWNENIFALICEELGWFGASILIILFVILLYQIFQIARIALASKDCFGTVLTFGVFLHILSATALNIAIHFNLLPYTTCTLPFVSYSNSSQFILFCEIGCVLSVNKQCLENCQR